MEYVDVDVYGRKEKGGDLQRYASDKALSNAMVFYLTTNRGDFVYNSKIGGVLEFLKFKLMNISEGDVQDSVRLSLEKLFGDYAAIVDVFAEKLLADRRWRIAVIWLSKLTGEQNGIEFQVNSGQRAPQAAGTTVVSMPYAGENLYNFILLQKEFQPADILHVNKEGVYVWGVWAFPELTSQDEYFGVIKKVLTP